MPMTSIRCPMIVRFQAMGQVRESLICPILRKGVADIPLLLLTDRPVSLCGCMAAQPIVDTISLVSAVYFCRSVQRRLPAASAEA